MKSLLIVYLTAYVWLTLCQKASASNKTIPLVVITWDYKDAAQRGNYTFLFIKIGSIL